MGWLTSDATILRRVSEVIFNEKMPDALPKCLVVAVDAFKFASTEVAAALRPMIALLGRRMEVTEEVMAPAGINVWGAAQRRQRRSMDDLSEGSTGLIHAFRLASLATLPSRLK